MFPAAAIANAILEKADRDGEKLTNMKLQKLVYISHGWHLAVTGQPLILEPVQAWKYGPVVPELYDLLRQYGRDAVTAPVPWFDRDRQAWTRDVPQLPSQTCEVLDKVWGAYKHLNGLQLSALTHEKGTPWFEAVGDRPESQRRDVPIPDASIRKYYLDLGRRN